MAEYIEKNATVNILEAMSRSIDCECIKKQLEKAAKRVSAIPAADVEPMVHGRWDNIPNTYMSVISKDGTYHGNATTCSVCHEVNPNAYKTNYCPNCGAKMDIGE